MPEAWCHAGGNRKRVRRYAVYRARCRAFDGGDALSGNRVPAVAVMCFWPTLGAIGTGLDSYMHAKEVQHYEQR